MFKVSIIRKQEGVKGAKEGRRKAGREGRREAETPAHQNPTQDTTKN